MRPSVADRDAIHFHSKLACGRQWLAPRAAMTSASCDYHRHNDVVWWRVSSPSVTTVWAHQHFTGEAWPAWRPWLIVDTPCGGCSISVAASADDVHGIHDGVAIIMLIFVVAARDATQYSWPWSVSATWRRAAAAVAWPLLGVTLFLIAQ